VEDFAIAGVARLSIGGGLANAAYGALVEAAADIRDHGRFSTLGEHRAAIRDFKRIIGN
jgi:2-methylisocitrate lyase-like PEP mutase family enzyme